MPGSCTNTFTEQHLLLAGQALFSPDSPDTWGRVPSKHCTKARGSDDPSLLLSNAHIIPPYWHHLQPQHPGPDSGKATPPSSLPHPHGKLRAQSFTPSDTRRLPAVGRQLSPCQRPNGEHAKPRGKEAPGEPSLCGTAGAPQPPCPTSPPPPSHLFSLCLQPPWAPASVGGMAHGLGAGGHRRRGSWQTTSDPGRGSPGASPSCNFCRAHLLSKLLLFPPPPQ